MLPARCSGCGLRRPACLCDLVRPAPVRTRVVLLTHHAEHRKSTNTGRLVALALQGAEIRLQGERDAPPRPPLPEGRRLLLFPTPEARELGPEDAQGGPVVLLVPDGNWSQARRLARRDPDAHGAEPVRLPPGPPSRYGLRRSPREDTVCTLEAVAQALAVIEDPAIRRHLMDILDVFVERTRKDAGRG